MAAPPPVSAVVINRNGGARLERCMEALLSQDVPPREVILVDDASTDDSRERIPSLFPSIRLVALPTNVGPAAARNAGLQSATDDLVLVVDADVYLDRDCLRRLLEAQARQSAVAYTPRILMSPGTQMVQADGAAVHFVGTLMLRNGYQQMDAPLPELGPVDACLSGCLLLDRRQVLEAGGFDEEYFMLLEDMEFGLRLRSLGHQLIYVPTAVVMHDGGDGSPGLSYRGREPYPEHRAFMTMRNRTRTLLLHYRLRTLIVLAPALLLYELASVAATIRRGWIDAWWRSWQWQWRHVSEIRERRRWIQQRRTRPDRDLLQAGMLPFAPGFLQSGIERRAVQALSHVLSAYWWIARPALGSSGAKPDSCAGQSIAGEAVLSDAPRVSVIIPCRDRPALLRECLEALSAQPPAYLGEIVVVDTSSDNQVANVVREFPNVRRLTSGAGLLPGPARNLGVRETADPLIAFLDADCRPGPQWLPVAVRSLMADADLVGGPILDARPWHPVAAAAHFLQCADFGPRRTARAVPYLPGANLAMRRDAFVSLGGFADCSGEDTLLTRAASVQWPDRVRFHPRMIVHHTSVASYRDLWRRYKQLGFDRARTGPPPTVLRWLGSSQPAALVAGVVRLGYIVARTLQWHPTAVVRLLLFLPWVCMGLAAWGGGYAQGRRRGEPSAAA